MPTANPPGPRALRLTSWNIENLAPYLSTEPSLFAPDAGEAETLGAIVDSWGRPDVVCLQEVRLRASDRELAKAAERALPDYDCGLQLNRDTRNATFRGGRMYGVATFVRRALGPIVHHGAPWDLEGRVLASSFGTTTVVNVYAVNGTGKPHYDHDAGRVVGTRHEWKRRMLERLRELVQTLVDDGRSDVVLVGDWNISRTVRDTYPRLRTEEPHAAARAEFNDAFLPRLDMVDVFRELHPRARRFTWFRRGVPAGKDAARVDFALVPRAMLARVSEADICDEPAQRYRSDHAPIVLTWRPRP